EANVTLHIADCAEFVRAEIPKARMHACCVHCALSVRAACMWHPCNTCMRMCGPRAGHAERHGCGLLPLPHAAHHHPCMCPPCMRHSRMHACIHVCVRVAPAQGTLSGTIVASSLSPTPLTITSGDFHIWTRVAAGPNARRLLLSLTARGADN